MNKRKNVLYVDNIAIYDLRGSSLNFQLISNELTLEFGHDQ